ncbi:unnamed protein product [Gongylonema pulchrum]|uniref:Transposase n=1 Tax=Gongylonema pulchrum TaxID=637853 RepID=A0A183EJZ1_9BILA|nr:unnamed protein product [Gongylonema pulchrum]
MYPKLAPLLYHVRTKIGAMQQFAADLENALFCKFIAASLTIRNVYVRRSHRQLLVGYCGSSASPFT